MNILNKVEEFPKHGVKTVTSVFTELKDTKAKTKHKNLHSQGNKSGLARTILPSSSLKGTWCTATPESSGSMASPEGRENQENSYSQTF